MISYRLGPRRGLVRTPAIVNTYSGHREQLRPVAWAPDPELGGRTAATSVGFASGHCLLLPSRRSFERDPVGTVHEAVQDRVGERRVPDPVVPLLRRQLAGHDRGADRVAILEDLEPVVAFLLADGPQAPDPALFLQTDSQRQNDVVVSLELAISFGGSGRQPVT
jgi:hypothetical protein